MLVNIRTLSAPGILVVEDGWRHLVFDSRNVLTSLIRALPGLSEDARVISFTREEDGLKRRYNADRERRRLGMRSRYCWKFTTIIEGAYVVVVAQNKGHGVLELARFSNMKKAEAFLCKLASM